MVSKGLVFALLLFGTRPARAGDLWPELSSPPREMGGGEKDAAVIVGVESYAKVAQVPGAIQNANDWHAYLTGTLGVPVDRVALLRDDEATLELMREKTKKAAAEVEAGGTLWFVYIGHGAPSKDGKDGLLVGWDAQQRPESLFSRSLSQSELLSILGSGKQAKTVVLIDACFSGRTPEGAPLMKGLQPLILKVDAGAAPIINSRTILMTAAKSDQFAGPLPGASRPAFSYLALGGLRGWADAKGEGKVTAEGLWSYVGKALRALGAEQEPELVAFKRGQVLSAGVEKGPDLGEIVRRRAPAPASKAEADSKSAKPAETPKAEVPKEESAKKPEAPAIPAPPAEEPKSPAPPQAPAAAPRPSGNADIEWVRIPGGSFMMGSAHDPSEDMGRALALGMFGMPALPQENPTEPMHRVAIRPFKLAKTLVTNKQYRACVSAGSCSAQSSECLTEALKGDEQPAVCLDWNQAEAFAEWAGGRLPTEAEWEYAARSAGKDQKFPWGGDAASCERAVISDGGDGCGRNATWPVCSKPKGATKQGLCDMAGNAREWVQDRYHGSYGGAPSDGSAWEDSGFERVGRGGSWYSAGKDIQATGRGHYAPDTRNDYLGFRPAKDD